VHKLEEIIEQAPASSVNAGMRAARIAGTVLGVMAAKVLGKRKPNGSAKPMVKSTVVNC
jgi:hypothetical protein